MTQKPEIVERIERVLGGKYTLKLPKNQVDPLRGIMGYLPGKPRYALDKQGRLVGLNLAGTGLTDSQWEEIIKILNAQGVALQSLDLNENKLSSFVLEPSLLSLQNLDIDDNPVANIPDEIKQQGKAAVLRFVKQLQIQGSRELYEVKMLIVGEGETGKTTLWNLLQNPDHPVPDPTQKSTVGIQIKPGWTFKHLDLPDINFLVNLWDFGGQDIQYMTHQFFLTHRSFYVLLADGRREVANFPYWLQIIELLGCDPKLKAPLPMMVVLNEKGNPIATMPYDAETIKKDYPKLNIIKREVDFAKKDGRIEAVVSAIKDIICHQIEHLPLTIPIGWDEVRRDLVDLKSGNHITQKEFQGICTKNKIYDVQQQDDLSRLLHDLGVILHFREDIELADFVILNPEWAVDAVYEIMKHEEVKKVNQGRFDQQLLNTAWSEKGFSAAEKGKLLNLMLKDNLEVCFPAKENGRKIYITPQLLPEERPSNFYWQGSKETLRYIYHYPFMPKGIIGRLIVRLNEYIQSEDNKKVVWMNGMVMKKDNCVALVQFQDDKEKDRKIIRIEVQGATLDDRKNVLRDIRNELNFIHRRSFPSLRVFQKIPCNCTLCKESLEPNEHDYFKLNENLSKNGKEAKAQCQKSFEMIPVHQLLDGVFQEMEMENIKNDHQQQPIIIQNHIYPMTNQPIPNSNQPNDATTIYSYLSAVIVAGGVVFIFITSVDFWKALLGIVSLVLIISIVGAFQLQNDKRLSEKSFMELMGMILKKIPPLNLFVKK